MVKGRTQENPRGCGRYVTFEQWAAPSLDRWRKYQLRWYPVRFCRPLHLLTSAGQAKYLAGCFEGLGSAALPAVAVDAVHLGTAWLLNAELLGVDKLPLVLVCADERLIAIAQHVPEDVLFRSSRLC